jgi:glycerol-3-phosphate O-acyltransferase
LFEQKYFAKEAKEGIFKPQTNLLSLMQSFNLPKDHLGKVFVTYSEPIDLNQYVEDYTKISSSSFKNQNTVDFEKLSMQLTNDLYDIQMK